MHKKILPTMIGALLMGGVGVAAADITLFGHIDTSLDAIDQDGGADDINMNCTTCSIGFKGSEDLGNGLKAIFSLDFQYDTTERNNGSKGSLSYYGRTFVTDVGVTKTKSGTYLTDITKGYRYAVTKIDHSHTGKDALFDRDQWLGLAGSFGQVRFGTISTGYKSHGAMLDPLYRTSLQGRDRGLQSAGFHSGAGEELQGRATNTVRYDSPSFNGVKVVGHYTIDNSESDGENDNPYGIGASYENGGILVFADYVNNARGGDGEKTAWKLGGKYTTGMFSVMGQYEAYDDQTSETDDETIWHIGGTAGPLFGISAYLGYAQGDDDDDDDDYTAWTLALMHSMSKSTMVYGGFSQVDCDDDAATAPCNTVGSGGGEDDKFSIGLKHKF